jgi:hypothetical protein
MYKLLLFITLSLTLTSCFDMLEHIVVKPDGSADLRLTISLDSGFIRMMSMADFDDSVRSLAAFGDTIDKQFKDGKKKVDGAKGFRSYDVTHLFEPDSTLIVTTVISIDDVLQIPKFHSLFWDIENKEKANEPSTFPMLLDIRKHKNSGYDFSFLPRPALTKKQPKITQQDTVNIGAIAGRTLEIRISAPSVTSKANNTDAVTASWKLPLRELVLMNAKVMKGSTRFDVK